MKRHKVLFDRVVCFENLHAAARKALCGRRTRSPGFEFLLELERELIELREELLSGSYLPGDYHYFQIYEPKCRTVAAAPFRDRVVHHAIVRVIQPLFEARFISDSFACRPGKGTHRAMRRALFFARKYPFALKCDIQKYFPSIDHGILMAKLYRVIGDERLLKVIEGILASHVDYVRKEWPVGGDLFDVIDHSVGLPIGNLTSQFFANVYLDALDQFVKHELRIKGYVRYVDDFLLFSESRCDLRRCGEEIRKFLDSLKLRIHPDKYRLTPTGLGMDFVGFVVRSDGRVRVRSSSAKRFRDRYEKMCWEIKRHRRKVSEVTRSVIAWSGHVEHAQSYRLRTTVLSRRK